LSVQEQVALLTALVKLIRALQLQGEIPVARMCVSCEHFHPHAYAESDQPHHCDFYNAAFGDQAFRLDCPEYVEAPAEEPSNSAGSHKAASVTQAQANAG
jgi:hypothetical protein